MIIPRPKTVIRNLVWNTERTALLIQYAEAGYSASEIARKLGTTRNAVCGKATRIGVRLGGTSLRSKS